MVCRIPSLPGAHGSLINRFNDDVLSQNNVEFEVSRPNSSIVYHFRITWTEDAAIRSKLEVLQCVAIFKGSSPCRTSVVNINFVSSRKPGVLQY